MTDYIVKLAEQTLTTYDILNYYDQTKRLDETLISLGPFTDVRAFGADPSNSDNYTAFYSALAYLASIGGGTLLIPGYFKIGTTLLFDAANPFGVGAPATQNDVPTIRLLGAVPPQCESAEVSTIGDVCGLQWVGATNDPIIKVTGSSYLYSWRGQFHLENLYLNGNNNSSAEGVLLEKRVNRHCTLRNVVIKNTGSYGLRIGEDSSGDSNTFSILLDNVTTTACTKGMFIKGNDITLLHCLVENCLEGGLFLEHYTNNLRYIGGAIQHSMSPQVTVDGTTGPVCFDGVYFEGQSTDSLAGAPNGSGTIISCPGANSVNTFQLSVTRCRFSFPGEDNDEASVVDIGAATTMYGFGFIHNIISRASGRASTMYVVSCSGTVSSLSTYYGNYFSSGRNVENFNPATLEDNFYICSARDVGTRFSFSNLHAMSLDGGFQVTTADASGAMQNRLDITSGANSVVLSLDETSGVTNTTRLKLSNAGISARNVEDNHPAGADYRGQVVRTRPSSYTYEREMDFPLYCMLEYEGTVYRWVPMLPGGSLVETHTSNHIIHVQEHSTTYTNAGAIGTVKFTLPPAQKGLRFTFIRSASQVVEVDTDGTEVIRGGAAGAKISLTTDGATLTLQATGDTTTHWEIVATYGTIAFL